MARSGRSIRRRRRQRTIGVAAGVAALLLAAGALAITRDDGHRPSACVIADVSESTAEAREEYSAEFAKFATEVGLDGSGHLCVIVAAADPLAEGTPEPTFVGPEPGNEDGPEAASEVRERVAIATDDFESLLENPPVEEAGSALVEAAAQAAEVLEPDDRLMYLSDGIQWSEEVVHLTETELGSAEMAALFGQLEGDGMLPDFDGTEVRFPFLGYHPDGLDEGSGEVRRFWDAWAEATGADLVVREPLP